MFNSERRASSLTSVKPDATAQQPGVALLRRLPQTLTGPARLRRRKRLFREWALATVSLRGSALIILARGTQRVISTIDVHHVSHTTPSPTVALVTVRSSTAISLHLRFDNDATAWLDALYAVVDARAPPLSHFRVLAPIGKGGGGEVYLVNERDDEHAVAPHRPLALKVVQKHDAFHSDGSLRHVLDERLVMELVRGFPFVVNLTHAFQTDKALYMVSDFCQGGNLKTVLNKAPRRRLSEPQARRYMSQIILAIEHIHSLNVIYRDVKPENVLLDANGNVRLCDFGLSKMLSTGRFGRTKSFCGSTSYMSPQIVTGKWYGIGTDLWSLGALFYRMLVGYAPFDDHSNKYSGRNDASEIEKRIQLDDVRYPSFLSDAAMEMLSGLLKKKEEERMNLQDLKEALFFEDVDWEGVLDEGYQSAAALETRPSEQGFEVGNFDTKRLQSHGIRLEDEELQPRKRKAHSAGGDGALRSAFKARRPSRLAMRLRHGSDLPKVQNATSVVGFGYSYASLSDLSTIRSDTTASTSSDARQRETRAR
ncbi:unnamed protein product [Agarophyton chilense]